VRRPWYARL